MVGSSGAAEASNAHHLLRDSTRTSAEGRWRRRNTFTPGTVDDVKTAPVAMRHVL